MTQHDLATALGQPQSFVSKIESGERSLHVDDLEPLTEALGYNVSTLFNRITGLDSILDRWDLNEAEFTDLVDTNPSLRGMVLGYAAEVKFRHLHLNGRRDIIHEKDDDHNRAKKGDRRLQYKGRELVVEVKSLQTNSINYDETDDLWKGKTQVDASDKRRISFEDGSELETTLLLRGEFDILAVNCFAFENKWRFAFALNKDLATSTYNKYTVEQQKNLIASLQPVTWPPAHPFTSDWNDVLERAWQAKQPDPQVEEVEEV